WLGRVRSGVLRLAHADLPTLVGTDLRLTHGEAVAVLPLSVRSDVRGLLIVSTTARISPEVADSLDALGTQVSLALEGASLAEDLHHRDGTLLRFEIQHTDLLHDEHEHGVVLNSRDVSERKAFEDQLQHQAFHDPVTNLANRALFSDRVEHALMRAQRGFADIAVMFIDLDDFKTVNDSLGHAAGDLVLQEVAR